MIEISGYWFIEIFKQGIIKEIIYRKKKDEGHLEDNINVLGILYKILDQIEDREDSEYLYIDEKTLDCSYTIREDE